MAVSDAGFRIILRAAQIRVNQGEDVDEVIETYPKLSSEQVEELRKQIIVDQ